MKRVLMFVCLMVMLTGCGNSNRNTTNVYNGKETALSKQYLSKGYIVNVYRSMTELGDDEESYGKGYVTMTFQVITDYTSTVDYEPNSKNYIKKKIVSNVRLIKTPKMGMPEEIYGNYDMYGNGTLLVGTKNKFEKEYEQPHSSGVQSSLAVKVNRIALFDSLKYDYNATPSTSQIYSDLGITRDSVALTLGFRVELITVDNKVLYKDYEVSMPPSGFDIGGTEFQMDFTTDNVEDMEPFLEKQ